MSFSIGSIANQLTVPSAGTAPQAQTLGLAGGGMGFAGPGQAQMGVPGAGKSILTKVLLGGALGAAAGFGASFIIPGGPITAPWFAAIGGAVGAIGGLVMGLMQNRKQKRILGMQQQQHAQMAQMQAQAQMQASQSIPRNAGVQPISMTAPGGRKAVRLGDRGTPVRYTQKALKRLGLYRGTVTGKLDTATSNSIKRYELMKGVEPTGVSTPALRAAIAEDLALARRFG